MLVYRGNSEFTVDIRAVEGEWEGKIVEHQISRIVPTVHLCHNWTSYAAALAGVRRRWQRLFPEESDEDMPDFQEALLEVPEDECPVPYSPREVNREIAVLREARQVMTERH